ncbi:hypothetical protein VE01_10777 [Pseudogymnoascus verrucosus]|uniref:Uncharacterized protein n=1 Tax=Pseudogymnoascus verrucosus TaxID=342668 RepID=A0A2P6FGV6_9PEZI|nr:uncharacterized protein VE01_10777 [Pseudogymnoascus verrucosus]PQM43881.1 hypothetical protein VE01_10777 [Pseudogymnoascus verrucosus]
MSTQHRVPRFIRITHSHPSNPSSLFSPILQYTYSTQPSSPIPTALPLAPQTLPKPPHIKYPPFCGRTEEQATLCARHCRTSSTRSLPPTPHTHTHHQPSHGIPCNSSRRAMGKALGSPEKTPLLRPAMLLLALGKPRGYYERLTCMKCCWCSAVGWLGSGNGGRCVHSAPCLR